jgi:hypothetical protein
VWLKDFEKAWRSENERMITCVADPGVGGGLLVGNTLRFVKPTYLFISSFRAASSNAEFI